MAKEEKITRSLDESLASRPWVEQTRTKLTAERSQLLLTESYLSQELKAIRERINELTLLIGETYAPTLINKRVVNEGVNRASRLTKQLGLDSAGMPVIRR